MCVLSRVMDYYQPKFPDFDVDEFKRAVEAAKTVDMLTKQPDCEDPEKAKLIEKVEKLEAELKALKKSKRRR